MVTATRKEIIKVAGTIFEIEVFHLSDDEFDRVRFPRKMKAELFNDMITWVATAEDVIKRKGELLDFDYITQWCSQHGTLEILAKAHAETQV
jgi:hypothetical protein